MGGVSLTHIIISLLPENHRNSKGNVAKARKDEEWQEHCFLAN